MLLHPTHTPPPPLPPPRPPPCRYPNSHTHYFSCVLLTLFSEVKQVSLGGWVGGGV